MDAGAVLIGLALLVISLPYIASPFWNKIEPNRSSPPFGSPGDRQAVLSALRDLDFDYRVGKVNEVDYAILRARLLTQAAALAKESEAIDAEIETLIRARREVSSKSEACWQCGAKVAASDRFCSTCGAERRERRV